MPAAQALWHLCAAAAATVCAAAAGGRQGAAISASIATRSLSLSEIARRSSLIKGVLEVGVVGTLKELWAKLNDDGGMPASQIMRVARSPDELGGVAD